MKTANYFKQFLPAVAALTLVGTVSSCRDNDFDWDDAHANTQYEKFSNVFIEKFGKPADGHQWGFDLAKKAFNGDPLISAETRAQNDHFFKQDEGSPRPRVLYGSPDDICLNEHEEVFAWFSTHKVDWKDNPAYYGQFNDSEGNVLNTRDTNSDKAVLSFEWYQKWVDANIKSIDDIAKLADAQYRGYKTLPNYTSNPIGDYEVNANQDLDFHNGWIQCVAHDPTNEKSQQSDTYSSYTNMDYVCFRGLEESGSAWASHSYDFNSGTGYGWYTQNDTINHAWTDSNKNASLYLNVDFNDVTYHNSQDSKSHDKFLLVYLKGDDGKGGTWEGWYLGFDLEGYMDPETEAGQTNKYLQTDGFCNDVIIKINNAGVGVFKESRIMCEDLGGTITKNSSDIDYNDIVLDISFDQNGGGYVDVTPKCAGGTLPILICYNDNPLFEVHEFFLASDDQHRAYNTNSSFRLTAAQYKTMINTKGNKTSEDGSFATADNNRSYRLRFGGQSNNNQYLEKSFTGKFDVDLLQIKVYRHNLEDYVTSPGSISDADWVNLNLLEDGVPLKFLVPKTWTDSNWQQHDIKWLQERQMITNGYKSFNKWVENPSLWFWQDVQSGTETVHTPIVDNTFLY